MAYARPVLCRLCGFPAPDGGVLVSEVDREKLSEWCLRMMDTELDQEGLEKAVFCQFCVADARFEHQVLRDSGDVSDHSGWWMRAKISNFNKFYFEDEIQPCAVQIGCLTATQIEKLSRGTSAGTNLNVKEKKKKNIHKCLYCPMEFYCKLKMKNHAFQTHKEKPIFRCQLCSKIYKSKLERQKHFVKAHKDKFLCIYCGARFQYNGPYRFHMQNWHKKEAIQCTAYNRNCSLYFKTKADLEKHIKEKHESGANKIKCVYCGKFLIARKMFRHVRQKHRLEAIRCDKIQCITYFLSQEEKEKHLEKVHRNQVQCIYCKKIVKAGSGEYCHMKKYHQADAIKCNFTRFCATYFLTEEERQQHIRDVHEAKLWTKAQCIYCKKFYPDFRSLYAHVKHIHSEVMIKCKWLDCHLYFFSDLELKRHLKQAHKAKYQRDVLLCNLCPYKTCEKRELKRHIFTHHGGESLQCPKCPKVLKSEWSLNRHVKQIHKPKVTCNVCLKKLTSLRSHLRRKNCPNCDFIAKCTIENAQHKIICVQKHFL